MKNLTKEQELEHKKELLRIYEDELRRQKEIEEESVNPFVKWLEGFGDRLDFVARTILYVSLVVLGAAVGWSDANSFNREPQILYGSMGAAIGYGVAYIIHKIFLLIINFLLWIITGK